MDHTARFRMRKVGAGERVTMYSGGGEGGICSRTSFLPLSSPHAFAGPCKLSRREVPSNEEGGREEGLSASSSSSLLIQGLLSWKQQATTPSSPSSSSSSSRRPLLPSPSYSSPEEEEEKEARKKEVGEISWEKGPVGGKERRAGRAPPRPTLCKKFSEEKEEEVGD